MSIKARVKRLLRSKGARCPSCPSLAIVYVGDDLYGASETQEEPAPCPRCGRPAQVISVEFVDDFYNNAHLLEGT
jgi:hypothetical protein